MSQKEPQNLLDLIIKAKGGNAEARLAIIESNMESVKTISNAFAESESHRDELHISGIRGITKAIAIYDDSIGISFNSLVNRWVRQYIMAHEALRLDD
jgi:DNA-directed RNA polymerase specialized sigma subunit